MCPDEPFDFSLVNDERAGIHVAIAGDTALAGLTYNFAGENRLLLLATSVFPMFHKLGVAAELIRRVVDALIERTLDEIADGKKITVICPVVGEFIARNPQYLDLIDKVHPGSGAGPQFRPGDLTASSFARNSHLLYRPGKRDIRRNCVSLDLNMRNNGDSKSYEAVIDGEVVGMIVYHIPRGDQRVTLSHTIVKPEYRGRGVATRLVKYTLDELRARDQKLTNYCTFVADYIADHPSYKELIDGRFPGHATVPDRAPRERPN